MPVWDWQMNQSSTTLASHAFSASICISFCNSFLALLFPLLRKASTDMRQILCANSALCSQAKCSHLLWVLVLFLAPHSLCKLQQLQNNTRHSLMMVALFQRRKLLVRVWLFTASAELLSFAVRAIAAAISEAWMDFRLVAVATPSHLLWYLSPPDSVQWRVNNHPVYSSTIYQHEQSNRTAKNDVFITSSTE